MAFKYPYNASETPDNFKSQIRNLYTLRKIIIVTIVNLKLLILQFVLYSKFE